MDTSNSTNESISNSNHSVANGDGKFETDYFDAFTDSTVSNLF